MDEVAVGDVDAAAGGAPALDLSGSLSVSDLHQLLDEAVRAAGLVHLSVTGTVTGLRLGPKFTTFELVDYEDDGATVRAVLSVGVFARFAREIRKTLAGSGAELVDGLQVSVWGPLDLNPRYGRLRLLAQRADPRTTLGAAVLAREELLAELDRSGRLRAQSALVVPAVPRRIGLVSSPAAAGRADVLEVLRRSPLPLEVVEATAAMSGPGAAGEVSRALGVLSGGNVDVILIARGGGALCRDCLRPPGQMSHLARSLWASRATIPGSVSEKKFRPWPWSGGNESTRTGSAVIAHAPTEAPT